MACPKNPWCFYVVARQNAKGPKFETGSRTRDMCLSASLRLSVSDSCWDCEAEVTRKGAKALKFESGIRSFEVFLLLASLRLGVKLGCIESDRATITSQPNCSEEECRRDRQPNPKIRRAQVSSRGQLCQRVNVCVMLPLEIKSLRGKSRQAVPQHFDKMRGVESNLFEDA